ncbi:hypothetical protein RSK20926_17677 [Roseobacter sp. SK209-2-6]|uniref:hypothetical protein n=1 Tax=Roseobacter sp. SK209-2-6 TaxID=388739 RepID=UPI0000F3F7A6|nr:hypothetical protein [Roseobacter sp. SK209-2-6]EBA17592.1 hypothetical protein RSK20926_17677 [Roseobacter sp. SK209-2-6]
MFLELIAVIFAGIALAGLVMLLNKVTGGRLPRWSAPVAAGLGMIAATIFSEYGWYQRNAQALPEGFVVVEKVENQSLYRPWTYLVPYYDRFAAIDTFNLQEHRSHPGTKLTTLYFFGRWAPVNQVQAAMDCQEWRRALITVEADFTTDGAIKGVDWIQGEEEDSLLKAACQEG